MICFGNRLPQLAERRPNNVVTLPPPLLDIPATNALRTPIVYERRNQAADVDPLFTELLQNTGGELTLERSDGSKYPFRDRTTAISVPVISRIRGM